MKFIYLFLLPAIFFLFPSHISACGYGFVGDCSTNIGLRINGTADSFAVAPCPGLNAFQGLDLGNIQTLALIRAKSINWESCQNNVTGVAIYYRVYQSGSSGGAWQTLNLQEDYNTLAGPYTTRYRSATANINLTNGLQVGKNYILEAYFRAEIDTIGDDFIPETFIVQNNNGANFQLNFRYGGPTAPPFTVVETKKMEPNCFADTTGSVSVAVYGNQNGLFYHWNNLNNNFYALYNIPAGTYAVTVTGAGGYTQADTILLGQPAPVSNQFTNLIPLGCNNGTGHVTAQGGGGTEPYSYHWNNGQSTATVTVNTPGTYTVTITDTHGCSNAFSQFISGGSAPINQNMAAEICQGETYHRGNQSFTAAGNYTFTLPGGSGCDTLVHLQLTVLDAGALLQNLPSSGLVTCAQPELSLCAATQPNVIFAWTKDGVLAVSTPCLLATAGGLYNVSVTLSTNNKVCIAEKSITITEHLQSPSATMFGVIPFTCQTTHTVVLHATTNAQNPTYLWTNNGQTLSTADTCVFVWTGALPLPSLVVTDLYGCMTTATNNVTFQFGVPPQLIIEDQHNLCNGLKAVSYSVFGGFPPYQYSWNNPAINANPFTVPPGLYSGTVTDAQGCSATVNFYVSAFILKTFVNPATGLQCRTTGRPRSSRQTAALIPTTVVMEYRQHQPKISVRFIAPGNLLRYRDRSRWL